MKRISTLLIALALGTAACGSDDSATSTQPGGTESSETTTAPAASSTNSEVADTSATLTLNLADTNVGSVLVDGDGNTVYLFTNDDGIPTCNDACADTWPPVVAPTAVGVGLDPDLIGSATRADGTEQATYGGWPLYYYAADTAPGDINGQGIGEVWFTIDATGNAIKNDTDTPNGYGY